MVKKNKMTSIEIATAKYEAKLAISKAKQELLKIKIAEAKLNKDSESDNESNTSVNELIDDPIIEEPVEPIMAIAEIGKCNNDDIKQAIKDCMAKEKKRITNIDKATKPKLLEIITKYNLNLAPFLKLIIEQRLKGDREHKQRLIEKEKKANATFKVGDIVYYTKWKVYTGYKIISETRSQYKLQRLKSERIKYVSHDPPYNQWYTETYKITDVPTKDDPITTLKKSFIGTYHKCEIGFVYEETTQPN